MNYKKYINQGFLCLLFISVGVSARSQNQVSTIGLLGGYSHHGIGVSLNYNYHTSRNSFVQGGVYYSSNITEVKGALEVPYHIFNVNIGYITNIYTSIRKNTKINIGGGGLVGYEEVNNGNHLLENGALLLDRSKFIYGGFALVELEIYLNNDINLILRLNEYYHMNSDLGQFTLFTGIGVRYFLF